QLIAPDKDGRVVALARRTGPSRGSGMRIDAEQLALLVLREPEKEAASQYRRAHVQRNIRIAPNGLGRPLAVLLVGANRHDSLRKPGKDQLAVIDQRSRYVLDILRSERNLPEKLAGRGRQADNVVLRFRHNLARAADISNHWGGICGAVAGPS